MKTKRNYFYAAGVVALAGVILASLLNLFAELSEYTLAVPLFFAVLIFATLSLLIMLGLITDIPTFLFASGLIVAAMVLRIIPLDYRSNDYNAFLSKWVQFFSQNGGIKGLGHKIGDYNFPYLYFLAIFSYFPMSSLYLIKFLSVVFDVILALYAMKIVSVFVRKRHLQLLSFFVVLMLPTIWVNSALWAQCDSIYSAFGLMALYYALKDRAWLSVACAAIAFSFKLQIIFLLPIYAVLLLTGKVKIKHLFAFPLVYVLITLPAIIFGRPLVDIITIYTSQVGSYSSYLTLNAPSIFAFVSQNEYAPIYSTAGVITAFACLFTLLFYTYIKRKVLDNRSIINLSLVMVILIPLLLPSMHERYFYLADVLSVIFAFLMPAKALVAVLVQFASWSGYHAYLIGGGVGVRTGAAALVIALFVVLSQLPYGKDIQLDHTLTR